jgi:hypothetical protein
VITTRLILVLAAATATVPLVAPAASSPTTPTPRATPMSQNESIVRLPISIRYDMIEKLVNEKAPAAVSGVRPDPTNALYDDTLRYTIQRGHITVSNGGNCIAVTVPVHGHATAHGRFGAGGRLGRLIASTSLQETANFRGTVHGCVSFDIAQDWTLQPRVSLNLDLDRAEVRLIRNWIPVSFRGLATEEFNKAKDGIVRDVTAGVVAGLDVQKQVQKAWESLHAVYPVSRDPVVYARMQPKRVLFQPLAFENADVVTVGVGLAAQIETFVGAKPASPTLSPLPTIEPAPAMAASSQLRVPVVVNLEAVNEQLARKFAEGPIDVDANRKLAITSAKVRNRGKQALLTLEYEVQRAWYLPDISGEVELTGQPVFDAKTQVLSFRNLNYTLQTRSTLVNAAAWLLKPMVLQVVQHRAKVDLLPHLAAARQSANNQAKLLASKLGTSSQLDVQDLRVASVTIGGGMLIAVMGSDVAARIDLALVE